LPNLFSALAIEIAPNGPSVSPASLSLITKPVAIIIVSAFISSIAAFSISPNR